MEINDNVLHCPHSYSKYPLAFTKIVKVVKKHSNGNVVTDLGDGQYKSSGRKAGGHDYTASKLMVITDELMEQRSADIKAVKVERAAKKFIAALAMRTDYAKIVEDFKLWI
jgi:hypothetical protein